ncbi:unnamed protein product [Closterium sp. NIES-64]|nr:unnamed protein product [Closterium sp. NIES-64]
MIAHGANAHVSAGGRWRGHRGGLSARRGGRPFAQIWSLSRQIAEEKVQSEKEEADSSPSGWEVTRGGRMHDTELVAIMGIARTRERIARRKRVTAVAKIGVAGVAWRNFSLAGAAAEPSAAKADGTNGARNQPRGEEKNDGGRRSSGPRSPNPRQHRDEKRGGEGRVSDLRQHRDVGRGDGALASGQRQHRDGGHAGGACSPDPRPQRDERREGGYRSPDPRPLRDERREGGYRSPDPRPLHEERRGSSYRSPDPRQRRDGERGGSAHLPDPAGGARGARAHQIRITIVMGDAKVVIARLTRDGTMEGGGEVRRACQIGVNDTRKAREADTARRRGSGAGMEGRALGLARLGGIGSVTKDVPVKEDRINAAAEWEAAG